MHSIYFFIKKRYIILAGLIVVVSVILTGWIAGQRISADRISRRASAIPHPIVSGVGVRLIHNRLTANPDLFSRGLTDPEIKFAALHIPLVAALAPNQTRAQLIREPKFNSELVEKFLKTWRDKRKDVALSVVVNGLGAKNANSTSATHDSPLPQEVVNWLGTENTISYQALEIDTLRAINRTLPNPCSSLFIRWYKRLIADAGTKLDGNPDLAYITFATGMAAGTSLGSSALVEQFRAKGCDAPHFGESTKSILRQTRKSFTRTPLIVGLGPITGADGIEVDRFIIRDLLNLSLDKLRFAGVETHTLSGNLKKMNNKVTYQEITSFIKNHPDVRFTRIDGVDDPLYCTNAEDDNFDNTEEEVNQSCGPRTTRPLGTFQTVTQAALNKLPGLSEAVMFPRNAIKFYSLDVSVHEKPENKVEKEFQAIDTMFKTLNTGLSDY